MNQDYSRLSRSLGYRFEDSARLTTALTHRSAGSPNNERFEFLGDAILSYIVAEVLFERFPIAREGELTRLRASLVKGDTLADVARKMELGKYLRLGGGELKSGGWRRTSILADALEAVIGAVYLDGDIQICKKVVTSLLNERLDALSPHNIKKDSKTQLQEYLQAKKQPLPSYRVLTVKDSGHEQDFEIECVAPGLDHPVYGKGKNRRRAEQAAAEKAMTLLKARQ
ncbi:MAG: ribonuclease III [Gammaproteobacteria bacterium]|nr:ribonuclease III [Gammaproteobacteria bacterium]